MNNNFFHMELILIWGVLIILVSIMGLIFRNSHSFIAFALGNRSLNSIVLAATLAATFIGPGFTIGLIGKNFIYGPKYLFVTLGYILYLSVFGMIISPWIRIKFPNAFTLTDIFVEFYGPMGRVIVGFMSALLMIGFSAVMLRASASVGEAIFPGHGSIVMFIVGCATVVYVTRGGFRAAVWTDIFQLLFYVMVFGALLTRIFFITPFKSHSEFHVLSKWNLISSFLGFFFGEMLLPPYVQRGLASRDASSARNGYMIAAFIAVGWFMLTGILGWKAVQLLPDTIPEDHIIYGIFEKTFGELGLAVGSAGLLAIIMSSLSGLLNSGATSVTQDALSFLRINNTRRQIILARFSTLALFVTACLMASSLHSILDGLLLVYAVWAPAIIPSFAAGALGLRNGIVGIMGMVIGLIVALIMELKIIILPVWLPTIVVALIAGIFTLGFGTFIDYTWKKYSFARGNG